MDPDKQNADKTPKFSADLYFLAIGWNLLRLTSKVGYGSKHDFVRDAMQGCLEKSIISKEASENEIWSFLGISFEACNRVIMKNPYAPLVYDGEEEAEYWSFEFKKAILPEGWRLEKGCGCGREMEPSSFSIYDREQYLGTIAYFDLENEDHQSHLMKGLDLLGDPIQKEDQ